MSPITTYESSRIRVTELGCDGRVRVEESVVRPADADVEEPHGADGVIGERWSVRRVLRGLSFGVGQPPLPADAGV